MNKAAELPARRTTDFVSILTRLARNQVLQRAVRAILVSFGVMLIAFVLLRLIPGDPISLLLGDQGTPEMVAFYKKALGVDGTLPEQFISYMSNLLRGDLGTSIVTRASVNATIGRSLPVTLWLIITTVVMAVVLALPIALLAAIYRHTWFGHSFRIASSVLIATPSFYSGLLLLLFFAIQLKLAPVAGYRPAFPDNLRYLWLPSLTLSLVMVPIVARVLSSSIVDTLDQEFVETAVVRGLPRRTFFWRYLMRPSLAPTISLVGYMIGNLLSAAVVVELVFNLPGIGTSLIVEGVLARDYPIVQGIVLMFGLIVVIVSFVADILSGLLDPRTKVV